MHLGHDNSEITYTLGGAEIATATEEKDLGVYLSNDCKPSLQCTKSAAKAMSSLRVIRRTFKHIFKIMNGLVEMKQEHLFQMSHNVQTRSHRLKLLQEAAEQRTEPEKILLHTEGDGYME